MPRDKIFKVLFIEKNTKNDPIISASFKKSKFFPPLLWSVASDVLWDRF